VTTPGLDALLPAALAPDPDRIAARRSLASPVDDGILARSRVDAFGRSMSRALGRLERPDPISRRLADRGPARAPQSREPARTGPSDPATKRRATPLPAFTGSPETARVPTDATRDVAPRPDTGSRSAADDATLAGPSDARPAAGSSEPMAPTSANAPTSDAARPASAAARAGGVAVAPVVPAPAPIASGPGTSVPASTPTATAASSPAPSAAFSSPLAGLGPAGRDATPSPGAADGRTPATAVSDRLLAEVRRIDQPGGAVRGRDGLALRIDHEDLGSIVVRLRRRGGAMEVRLSSTRPETQRILADAASVLERGLRDAGLRPDVRTVSAAVAASWGGGEPRTGPRALRSATGRSVPTDPTIPGDRSADSDSRTAPETSRWN